MSPRSFLLSRRILLCCYIVFGVTPVLAKDVIFYGGDDKSYNYELLNHALSYSSSKDYQVSIFASDIPKLRAYDLLAENDGVHVVFGGATSQRELQNHAIKIPLLKGLNGWRIPLVKKINAKLLASKSSTEEFKKLLAGQFHLWSDVAVLQSNHVRVYKATNVEGLFQMLEKGHIDYFPRSVLEIWSEYQQYAELDIMIEQYSLIHYPTAYYFYVSFDNQELAKDLENGLESAINDGSFDALFSQHYGDVISRVNAVPRRVFKLNNPLLPPSTPLGRKSLWLDLGTTLPN